MDSLTGDSTLTWFIAITSGAAGLASILGLYLQILALRRDRPHATITTGVSVGAPEPMIAIVVHCSGRPFTVTGVGLRMEGGSIFGPIVEQYGAQRRPSKVLFHSH